MDLLEKIKIVNFRGFDDKGLEIDGLSKFNVFVGKNNCGKTSILEAIFISVGSSNPMLPSNLNAFRELVPHGIKYLFHNVSVDNKPEFNIGFKDSSRNVTISPKFEYSQPQNLRQLQNNQYVTNQILEYITNGTSLTKKLVGLDIDFTIRRKEKEQKLKSSMVFDSRGFPIPYQVPGNRHLEELKATFIPTYRIENGDLQRFTNIVKKQEELIIVDLLKNFDDRILSVQPLPDGIFFTLKDVKERVPSNIMGDGIRRFLNIITAVANENSSYICIDEIENGLHYYSQKLLLKNLLKFSEVNNVQLFITTHNIEILRTLKEVLEEDEMVSMRDYAKIFDIVKTKKAGFKSYKYSFNGFKTLLENETEIRE